MAETANTPDAAAYEQLIKRLREIESTTAESDALDASFEALAEVVKFLGSDLRLRGENAVVLRPLIQLAIAIYDLSRGAQPKLLFDRSEAGRHGPPTLTSTVLLRGHLVVAFLALQESGFSKVEAGRKIAGELKQRGIRHRNGRPITASQVIRWGAERGGKSPKGSDDVFDMIVLSLLQLRQKEEDEYKAAGGVLAEKSANAKRGAELLMHDLIHRLAVSFLN